MKHNKQGFSLVIAMGLVLISTLLAYTIIEYIMPFSRNIRGIEDGTRAYYYANSGLERSLYFFKTRENAGNGEHIRVEGNVVEATNSSYATSLTGYTVETFSSGSVLPREGFGNSPTDKNWNIIAPGEPIQLAVGNKFLTNIENLKIQFRIPENDKEIVMMGDTKIGKTGSGYIAWQLTGSGNFLNANSGSLVRTQHIDTYDNSIGNNSQKHSIKSNTTGVNFTGIAKGTLDGTEGNMTGVTIEEMFQKSGTFDVNGATIQGLNCADLNRENKCILKFSVVNPLKAEIQQLTSGPLTETTLPYLEWQITQEVVSSTLYDIPLRYSIVQSQGKSGQFARTLVIKVPQKTVNEALDFALTQ